MFLASYIRGGFFTWCLVYLCSVIENEMMPAAWLLTIVPTTLVTALTLAFVCLIGQAFRVQAIAEWWQKFRMIQVVILLLGLAVLFFTQELHLLQYHQDFHTKVVTTSAHPAAKLLGYLMIAFAVTYWQRCRARQKPNQGG
jgi:hypothetical protein